MKDGQKFIFHPRKAHILARLHITVLYTIFYALKNIVFQFKTQMG
jgi:hypothetical protein